MWWHYISKIMYGNADQNKFRIQIVEGDAK